MHSRYAARSTTWRLLAPTARFSAGRGRVAAGQKVAMARILNGLLDRSEFL